MSASETPAPHTHRHRRNHAGDDQKDIETVVDEGVPPETSPAPALDQLPLAASADVDSTASSLPPALAPDGVSEDSKRQIGAAAILSLVGMMAAAAGSGLVGGGSSDQTAKPENDLKPGPDTKPDPDPGTKPQPDPGTKPDPDPGTKPDPDPGTKPDPDPGTKPDPDPGTKPDPDPGTTPDPDPKPDPDPGTTPDPDPGTTPDPDPGTEPDPDLTPPERPTVSLVADTGDLGDDLLTREAILRVGGLEAGAVWRFSKDGGTTWTDGVGDRIPADQFPSDGAQSVLVEQIDKAGNRSEATSFHFTLDTRAPALSASLLVDTGASAAADPGNQTLSDRVTRVATVLIDGLESDRPWQFSLDGVTWREGNAHHQIDGSLFGADGAKVVHVRQVDAAGNIGESDLAFTLDRAIQPATIQVYDRNPFTNTYQPGSSTLTSVPCVHITAEPDAYWTYEFDTGERGHGRGTASIDPLWNLPEGERTVLIRVEDGAGNVATSQLTFTLDRTSPGPLSLSLVHDTGVSATDGITQDGTLAVSGLKPGDKWYYRVSSKELGDVAWWTEGDPDTMTIPTSALGADGKLRIDVMPMDAAGNIKQADMGTLWIELDRHADAPLLALKHDTGGSAVDYVTADSTVVILGVEAGATLSGWSAKPAQSSVDLSEALAAAQVPGEALVTGMGDKMLRVQQTDLAGNVSEASNLYWTHTTAQAADGQQVTLSNRPDQASTLLSGTRGADSFVWNPKTIHYTQTDVVTNYRADEGDVLDLSRIVIVEPGKTLSDYLVKTVSLFGEVNLFIHQPGDHVVDYRIAMWNVASTDAIRIQTADGVFTV